MNKKGLGDGFTIVELIVVIAVIGILASISIVSYSGAQTRARKTAATSTAEQVKLKIGEYFTDNNHYPVSQTATLNYLNTTGSQAVATDFGDTTHYTYAATTSAGADCSSDETQCQTYVITVKPAAWQGEVSDDDITIQP